MHVHPLVSTAIFVSLSVLVTPGWKARAADGLCIEQPDRAPPPGEHWYYRFDREKNRKCWHRGPAAPVVHESPSRPERSRSAGAAASTVFGPLLRGIRRLFHQPMPHDAAADEPRIVQSDATRPLTIEDIAQPQAGFPEERAEARPASSITAAQRKALFEEYRKWEESQRSAGGSSAVPARSR